MSTVAAPRLCFAVAFVASLPVMNKSLLGTTWHSGTANSWLLAAKRMYVGYLGDSTSEALAWAISMPTVMGAPKEVKPGFAHILLIKYRPMPN